MAAEDMEFTAFNQLVPNLFVNRTYLPHSAEYLTLMITSVWSTIFGIGRSSTLTSSFPLNTTAFIVVFGILLVGIESFYN